jgi:hypothetical protein
MDPRYGRPLSPGSRRLGNPMRSSTGSVAYNPSAYDDYYAPSRGSRDYGPSPRSSGDRIAAPRMLTRNYDEDRLSLAKPRDDFMARPRRSTLEPEPVAIRKPLSAIPASSPNRVRPVITGAPDRASGHHAKPSRSGAEEDYYLLPATSGSRHDHRRISSANAGDMGRLTTGDKERDRMDRGGYRGSTSNNGRQGYHLNGPLVRHQDTNAYDGYSYTDPREQMYRDTAPRPRPRGDSLTGGRRERPLSMTGLEDYLPRLGPAMREAGPPPSRRGFDKIPRSDGLRQNPRAVLEDQRARDYVPPRNEDLYDIPKRRSSTRKPVALHQQRSLDDGYESYQDPYDDPYERHRQTSYHDDHVDRRDYGVRTDSKANRGLDDEDYDRDGVRTKSRRDHEHRRRDYGDEEGYGRDDRDRGSRKKTDREGEKLAAGVAAGLSGGLLGAEISDRDRRRHEGRGKDTHEPSLNVESHDRDRHRKKATDYGGQDGDTSGEERRERRRRRRREKEALEREREERDPRDEVIQGRTPDVQDDDDRDSEEEEQRHRDHRHQHDESRERGSRDGSVGDKPVDVREERPRSAGVVVPAREKEPEQPVKGILRQPREKFPEDPAPVREGVAPLKDAGKKGIPVNARWTKIDRKLVNPEALEEGHERYEERLDYVIVLRVLTKEEIQEYAARTSEIRGKRAHISG